MIIRQKIWPKTVSDFVSMTFILTIVPLLYWFELWVVLPELFEPNTLGYVLHFLFGNFVMINIVGNFTYTVLCDTSTRYIVVPTDKAKIEEGWRYCSVCESVAPPRSWHCANCNVCILKRDHHCIFTGCCVGHYNHRYFLMFVFYLFIGTAYAFFYNNYFIWGKLDFDFPMSLLKIVFPLAMFAFGFDPSVKQFYLMLYIVTAVGMCFTAVLAYYHFNLVLSGHVANEKSKGVRKYSLGWMKNVVEVFGDKWYLTWIVPYVKSDLTHDGVSWRTKNCLAECQKSR